MAKSDKFYFKNFKECASLSLKAANYLVECLQNYNNEKLPKMLEEMHQIEHEADTKKHAMHDMLIRAFVTPVDREDLDMLSHQIDDVTDTIEEVLQKFYIYDIKEIPSDAVSFSQSIVKACELICKITNEFENFKKSKNMRPLIIELNTIEEECDKLYLSSMRKITLSEMNALDVISWRKIFEHLEACADACENVGECISSVIMKNT